MPERPRSPLTGWSAAGPMHTACQGADERLRQRHRRTVAGTPSVSSWVVQRYRLVVVHRSLRNGHQRPWRRRTRINRYRSIIGQLLGGPIIGHCLIGASLFRMMRLELLIACTFTCLIIRLCQQKHSKVFLFKIVASFSLQNCEWL